MRNHLSLALICTLSLLLSGCNLIEYQPYDTDISGPFHLTQQMIDRIESACTGKDTIRFAEISDTQRRYDETQELVNAINARGDIDFVIHCGDQTDFGLTKEFEWQRKIMTGFKMPWVCIIGNHDCLGTGEDVYSTVYGADNFSFNAGFIHFICLNTNAFEYDYSANIPDFTFIKKDLDSIPKNITHTIVAMHARPYSEQFNNNIADYFNSQIHLFPGLTFCICGHDHHTTVYYPFSDQIPYYECASANYKTYLLFTVTKDSYTYEAVQL